MIRDFALRKSFDQCLHKFDYPYSFCDRQGEFFTFLKQRGHFDILIENIGSFYPLDAILESLTLLFILPEQFSPLKSYVFIWRVPVE